MAITHYLDLRLGAIRLYSSPYERSYLFNLAPISADNIDKQVKVEILEEFAYPNCEFTKIKINDLTVNTAFNLNEYYIKNNTGHLKRLSQTPESAPVNCEKRYTQNTAYEKPDFQFLTLDQVYFNSRELTYSVPISTPFTFLDNTIQTQQRFQNYCKRKGIELIFKHLSKQYSQSDIDRYLNYFIFANVEDYEVSYTRGGRIKALVSIHVKYLDAVPTVSIEQLVGDITDVIKIDTFELGLMIRTVSLLDPYPSVFNYYHKNTTKIGSVKFSDKFTFEKEAKNLNKFYEKLVELIRNSQASYSERNKKDYIELALDKCNNIVYMSHYNSVLKACTRIDIGLTEINEMLKQHKYNSMYYMKEIKTIYIVNPCDLEFDQFIARFSFFKPTITKTVNRLEDLINKFLNSSSDRIFEILKDSITVVNEMTIKQDEREQNVVIEMLNLSEQIKEKRDQLKKFRNKAKQKNNKSKFASSNAQQSAYNNLSDSEIKEFEKIESELNSILVTIEQKRKELNFIELLDINTDPIKESFINKVVSLNNEIAKEFVGNNNLNPENNNIAENAKKQANESSKPKSKNETKKPDLSGTIDQIASDWNKRIQTLYDTLREAPICKILEVILKCLTILLNNAGLSFKVGSRKVFTYKELKEQVIPSLTVEQKRIFYNIFITEPCINKKAIIDIFTEVTGSESARYLSSLSYQQAKSQLILKLV